MTSEKSARNDSLPIPLRPIDGRRIDDPDINGSRGANRADISLLQIEARTDLEAIQCFLDEYKDSRGTLRVYTKELERLLLWSLIECRKPISSLNRQDFDSYIGFLENPRPIDIWCAKKCSRSSPAWRPFEKGLGKSARLLAMATVNSFMAYLVSSGYLRGNPIALIRRRRKNNAMDAHNKHVRKVQRFLDEEMWDAVTRSVDAMPQHTQEEVLEYERSRFILAMLVMLAPRAGELESHAMNSFEMRRHGMFWVVTGKGGKTREVAVPPDGVKAIMRYRKHLGLDPIPSENDETPILLSRDGKTGVTARRLNQLLKKIFCDAAKLLEKSTPEKATKLRKASAHWGRHTGITSKVDAGMEPRYVQQDAGHADGRTTSMYTHEEEARRQTEAKKQRLKWGKQSEAE
jgi:integrase